MAIFGDHKRTLEIPHGRLLPECIQDVLLLGWGRRAKRPLVVDQHALYAIDRNQHIRFTIVVHIDEA